MANVGQVMRSVLGRLWSGPAQPHMAQRFGSLQARPALTAMLNHSVGIASMPAGFTLSDLKLAEPATPEGPMGNVLMVHEGYKYPENRRTALSSFTGNWFLWTAASEEEARQLFGQVTFDIVALPEWSPLRTMPLPQGAMRQVSPYLNDFSYFGIARRREAIEGAFGFKKVMGPRGQSIIRALTKLDREGSIELTAPFPLGEYFHTPHRELMIQRIEEESGWFVKIRSETSSR